MANISSLSILIRYTVLVIKPYKTTNPTTGSELAFSEAHSWPAALWSTQQGGGNNASMQEQVQCGLRFSAVHSSL